MGSEIIEIAGGVQVDTIVIKEYTDGYASEIMNLILDIQQKEFAIPIQKEDQPDLSDIPNFYQRGAGNFWIAFYGEQVVGTVALIDIGSQQVALRKMFVKAEYRGKEFGTAQKLLGELFQWVKEKEIKNIFLGTTEKFLAAHRFYEKNGFSQISKENLPSSFPIMKVDTRFYILRTA